MRQVFLDTETTGLGPHDRIVEIACVEMIDRKLTGRTLHHYVNPGRPSHPEALRIHGIPDDYLATMPAFSEVADSLLEFIQGGKVITSSSPRWEVIAHNAAFDGGMLLRERLHIPITDSLAMARGLYPKQANTLDALAKRLGVVGRGTQFHGAMLDADLLARVYLVMTRSQDGLELESAQEVSGYEDIGSLIDHGLVIMATPEECEEHDVYLKSIAPAPKVDSIVKVSAC